MRRSYCVLRSVLATCVLALTLACTTDHASNAQPSSVPQGSGGINRAEHRQKPSLLLVSFDGFRADYLERFDLPNFRRVIARGTRARSLHPVFPSITFPNHYSLVTGLYTEHHGIVENSFFDPGPQRHVLLPRFQDGDGRDLVRRRADLGDGGTSGNGFGLLLLARLRGGHQRNTPDLLEQVRRRRGRTDNGSRRCSAG